MPTLLDQGRGLGHLLSSDLISRIPPMKSPARRGHGCCSPYKPIYQPPSHPTLPHPCFVWGPQLQP